MDAFIDSTIQLLIEWGLPGLFISALLAGSIVPFSSELVLVALVKLGLPPIACLISATLGNTVGGITEKTDDGSATLFVPELNEHYHSTKGARTESQHIFIDMGLKASSATTPHILEIGFGTGLNAWLTLEEAERSRRNIHYTGLELYPLEWQTIEQLGYISNDEQLTTTARQQPAIELFKQLHTSPWEKDVQLTPHFTLRKVETDVNKWVENRERTMSNINDSVTNAESPALNLSFNLIYFDAFAPEKQPEMWSQELFNRLYVLLDRDGILTTYCAKGVVRRMLQTAGFTVERLPGPPGGKREILRARK